MLIEIYYLAYIIHIHSKAEFLKTSYLLFALLSYRLCRQQTHYGQHIDKRAQLPAFWHRHSSEATPKSV